MPIICLHPKYNNETKDKPILAASYSYWTTSVLSGRDILLADIIKSWSEVVPRWAQ